jgi:hypothetical protein
VLTGSDVAKPGDSTEGVSEDGFEFDCGYLWRFGEFECDEGVVAGVGGWGGELEVYREVRRLDSATHMGI